MAELAWSGRAIFRPSNGSDRRTGMTLHMMAEDASQRIWYQLQADRFADELSNYAVSLLFEPQDERVASLAASLTHDWHSRDFMEQVPDFLRMTAYSIVADGLVVYEGQFGRNPETGMVERFALVPVFVPGGRVQRIGKRIIQLVPSAIGGDFDGERIRVLEPKDTFVFAAPRQWKKHLRRARKAARTYDLLWNRSMHDYSEGLGKRLPSEDLGETRRSLSQILARATAPLGWNARHLFDDYGTEFQFVDRTFRWVSFCLDLRARILDGLKQLVARIASEVGSPCRLVSKEGTQRQALKEAVSKLWSGDAPFSEIVKSAN